MFLFSWALPRKRGGGAGDWLSGTRQRAQPNKMRRTTNAGPAGEQQQRQANQRGRKNERMETGICDGLPNAGRSLWWQRFLRDERLSQHSPTTALAATNNAANSSSGNDNDDNGTVNKRRTHRREEVEGDLPADREGEVQVAEFFPHGRHHSLPDLVLLSEKKRGNETRETSKPQPHACYSAKIEVDTVVGRAHLPLTAHGIDQRLATLSEQDSVA